ncbi:MAG: hypothetical protein N2545_10070, partial [Thermoflexales bacterium]|nr:hypothetical protein [Thermoflexales bacterium]
MRIRITPISPRGANMRLTPEIRENNIIAVLPHGAMAQAEPERTNWLRVPIAQSDLVLHGARARLTLQHLYIHRTAVRVLAQQRVGIGLHLLNPQASDAGRVALQAYEAGMRHFTIIDDTDFARALADRMAAEGLTFGRDAGVVFRWWVDGNPYTPKQFADYFAGTSLMVVERGERKMHPLIAVVGHNEADVYGCWSAEHLRHRMPFERELAQRVIGDLGGRYAMVSFATGNPDILSPDL